MKSNVYADQLRLELRDDEWWIRNPHDIDMGPYPLKAEALDDLEGCQRFYREYHPEAEKIPTLEDLFG